MTDPTVVSLCRQYLQTWDNAILPLLLDRLEELDDQQVDLLKHRFSPWWSYGNCRFNWTVPAILKQYGGEP